MISDPWRATRAEAAAIRFARILGLVRIESPALYTLVIIIIIFSYSLFRGSVDCMSELTLLGVGLAAGVAAGMFGIGGGLIIVPALIFLLGMKEKQAIGTSLAALIPPVGLLGAAEYYRSGYINIKYAALIAVGLFIGAYFGAKIVISMPDALIRRIYAIFLLAIAARMLVFGK
jgi:hypothetical protein